MKSLEKWGRVLNALNSDPFNHFTPASICCFAFILSFYTHNLIVTVGLLLFVWLLLHFRYKQSNSFSYFILIFCWVLSGWFIATSLSPDKKIIKIANFWDKPGIVWEGEILPFADLYPDKIRFMVKVTRVFQEDEEYKINENILLTVKNTNSVWLPGDSFLARGKIKQPKNFNNPGRFDYVLFLARRKIFGHAYLKSDLLMGRISKQKQLFNPWSAIIRISESQRRKLSHYIKEATKFNKDQRAANGLLQAMLLGYKHFMTPEFSEDLSMAGVRHIVAVSGLHFGCMAGLVFYSVMFMLKRFRPSIFLFMPARTVSFFFALPLLIFYGLITGFAPPTIRAFIFIVIASLIILHNRHIDSLTVLSVAAFAIILIAPYMAFSPSFILSFTAVSAILFVAIPLKKTEIYPKNFKNLLRKFLTWTLWVSFVVQVFLLPVCLYFFHRFSLAGFLSNPLIVPVVTLIVLPFGLIFMLLACISRSMALHFYSLLCAKPMDILIQSIKFFSGLPHLIIWSKDFSKLWIFLYLSGLLASVNFLRKSKLLLKIVVLCLFPISFCCTPWLVSTISANLKNQYLQATIIDVSQGSSTFVKLPKGHTFLVDGGGFRYSNFDTGRNIILPFLASQKVSHIDTIVLSHYHPDHAKGLLFFARFYPVSEFWETGCKNKSFVFPDLSKIFRKRHITTYTIDRIYGSHRYDNTTVTILSPQPKKIPAECKNLNSTSMVIKFSYGNASLIVPGDVDSRVLSDIDFQNTKEKKTILVAPHHGSRYSFNKVVFEKINPCLVIVSCGYKNPYGSPHTTLLNWCKRKHIRVLRTDLDGAITLRTDGRKWEVKTFGTKHHWRTGKCGTIFSETYTVTRKPWKFACNRQKE